MLHTVRGVQAPGTHVRSDYPQTRHIGGRPSSHKANLIPQNKRQDTTIIAIPCLCSFTVPSSPSAEPPINKKRTQTLSRKESGSSTNCMVDGTGLEQQRRRPLPAAETGRSCWGRILIFQSPAKGLRKNQQMQPVRPRRFPMARNVYRDAGTVWGFFCGGRYRTRTATATAAKQ